MIKPVHIFGAVVAFAFAALPSYAQDAKPAGQKLDAATLCGYVKDKTIVSFHYDNDPEESAIRVIHPYGVGYTKRHSLLLLGEQQSGYSKSAKGQDNKLPDWRNFTVAKIKAFDASAGAFADAKSVPADEIKYISEFVCKNEQVK